jgi:hypothetical protein
MSKEENKNILEKPTAKKPTAKKPTAKKPTAKKPTAKKPTAKKPLAKKPTAKLEKSLKPKVEDSKEEKSKIKISNTDDSTVVVVSTIKIPSDINANIRRKKEIIKSLRELVDGQENKSTFNDVKSLQSEWKNIGQLNNPKDRSLWTTFNALLDRFYDNRSIYFELKELDRKKNLEIKLKLCDKAEKLIDEQNIMKAVGILNTIHDEFKHAGPAPLKKQDSLWERLKIASDKLYIKKKEFISNIKGVLNDNLDNKNQLLEKIKTFSNLNYSDIKIWNQKSKEILLLKDQWNNIGGTPRKSSKSISKEFWSYFKNFYSEKSKFFKKIDELYLSNLKLKNLLIEKVDNLKDSDDWINTSKEIQKIQKEWKLIGKVPIRKKDSIYNNFKKACDYFFERKKVGDKDSIKLFENNLEAKDKICDTIIAISNLKDFKQDDFLQLQIKFLELGFVPKKSIETISIKYKESLKAILDKAFKFMDSEEFDKFKFIIQLNSLSNNPFSKNKIFKKKSDIRNKINTIQTDIKNLKNNIDFLKESVVANNLKKEYLIKIENSDKEIDSLKLQLNLINKV